MTCQKVALLASGRTGTSMLFSLLSQVPEIVCSSPKEFSDQYSLSQLIPVMNEVPAGQTFLTHIKLLPISWSEERLKIHEDFKTIPELVLELRGLGFDKFVHLNRRNHLRWFVSLRRGWGKHNTNPIRTRREIDGRVNAAQLSPREIPVEKAMKLIQACSEIEARVESELGSEETLRLTYDWDLQENYKIGFTKFMNFLEIPIIDIPQTEFNRTNPFLLKDVISNFDEFQDAFAGTPWAWMLEE